MQSVAVRLIVERERELQAFKTEAYYSVNAIFGVTNDDGSQSEVRATLATRLKTHEEVEQFLEACKEARFVVGNVREPDNDGGAAPV